MNLIKKNMCEFAEEAVYLVMAPLFARISADAIMTWLRYHVPW